MSTIASHGLLTRVRNRLRRMVHSSKLDELRHRGQTQELIAQGLRQGKLKLHLGCAHLVLPGWLNIDLRPRDGVAVMRLPEGLRQLPDNSAQYVYCSHMVEHLEYPGEVLTFAKEVHRVLEPGGVFRFVVPGIERIIRAYAADDKAFFEGQKQHHPARCTTKLEHLMYALQQDGQHRYGYDFETAEKFLKQAGFSRVIDSAYNTSEFEPLRMDYRGEGLSLFVDAVK